MKRPRWITARTQPAQTVQLKQRLRAVRPSRAEAGVALERGQTRRQRHPRIATRSRARRDPRARDDQSSHHGTSDRAIGSMTRMRAPRAASACNRAHRRARARALVSSFRLQPQTMPVRGPALPRTGCAASSFEVRRPGRPRRARPRRPSARQFSRASSSAQALSRCHRWPATRGSASAHAAPATPVPQPDVDDRVTPARRADFSVTHDRARRQEMQRRVEAGECRPLAGRVER